MSEPGDFTRKHDFETPLDFVTAARFSSALGWLEGVMYAGGSMRRTGATNHTSMADALSKARSAKFLFPPPKVALRVEQLKQMAPSANAELIAGLVDNSENILQKYGITHNNLRLCHFLAQVTHETGHLRSLKEDTFYRDPASIQKTFSSRVASLEEAKTLVKDSKKLARKVYGHTKRAKPEEEVDYRGRGYLQITGFTNYARQGFAESPELLEDPKIALETAARYWHLAGINAAADRDDVLEVTKLVNGKALKGLSERRTYLTKCKSIWMTP